GGDLGMHIKRFGRFTEERVRFYMGQLALAIEHLHDHKIIHRDIKPDNILLDAKGNAVLADVGNPGYDPSCMCYEAYGSEAYMAPEMLAGNGYSFNVDIWALGVSAFEMRCG
ncbi:kinase-like protein, partial [Gloeophyllum trabeum ATCC 11539]